MKRPVSKQLLSLALVLALLCSMTATAFALRLSPSTEHTLIRAGETVALTLTLDEPIADITALEARLYFDDSLFTFVPEGSSTITNATVRQDVQQEGERSYVMINYIDMSAYGSIAAGFFASLRFTARADITAGAEATFSSCIAESLLLDGSSGANTQEIPLSVTLQPAARGYQVSLGPTRQSLTWGETARISVAITDPEVDHYNAVDLSLSYDPLALRFDRSLSTLPEDASVSDTEGALRIRFWGQDRSEPLQLAFTVIAAGESAVELLAAYVDQQANANLQDAPAATILCGSAEVACSRYPVSLSQDLSGESTAVHGEDYHFTVRDPHYDYQIQARMGDQPVTCVPEGDGYTIRSVTGPLSISAQRSPRTYSVRVEGSGREDVLVEETAVYLSDLTFTLRRSSDYSYDGPHITIDGAAFTGFRAEGDRYTIPGGSITGPVVITVERSAVSPDAIPVTVSGSGSGDFSGPATAVLGQSYRFTVQKAPGYTYQVRAQMNGADTEVTEESPGSYCIPRVSAPLSILVEKTAQTRLQVSEYVKLNGSTMWLITMQDASAVEQSYAYGGDVMYWSEVYEAFAWLVIADNAQIPDAAAMEAQAREQLSLVPVERTVLDSSGDINGTGLVDINDAQLIYNMYNARYEDFDTVSIPMFLRADRNGSRDLNVQDAAAVVALIH